MGRRAVSLLVAGIAAALPSCGAEDQARVDSGAEDSAESSTTTTSSTTTATSAGLPSTTTPTSSTTTALPVPTTSTAAEPVCRNSRDPVCGPFAWEPEPSNAPIIARLEITPETVRIGEELSVVVTAEDPDAHVDETCIGLAWGDGGPPSSCGTSCAGDTRYGPWDPPAPSPGRASRQFVHAYAEPGTYILTAAARSLSCLPAQLYESQVEMTATVTVASS